MVNDTTDGNAVSPARRLALVIAVAAAGLAVSSAAQALWGVQVHRLPASPVYGKFVSSLLAAGLFASCYGISRAELRRNAGIVLAAVTVGVVFKAGLVGAVMALAYGRAGFLLLGVAVAQIDPLSVAATLRRSGMSQRARSILAAWASFDDPVTVLLVSAGSFILPGAAHGAAAGLGAGAGSYLTQGVLNAALISVAAVAWHFLTAVLRDRVGARRRHVLQCLVLAGLLAAAAWYGLLIGITVCGLFYRPPVAAVMDRAVGAAFYAAVFFLGLFLVDGVDAGAGILLGVSVFAVQVLAGLAAGAGLPRADRGYLALGQQNGLTAIVLGLALQPWLPQAAGTIAAAVLVVNAVNIAANRWWDLKVKSLAVSSPRA